MVFAEMRTVYLMWQPCTIEFALSGIQEPELNQVFLFPSIAGCIAIVTVVNFEQNDLSRKEKCPKELSLFRY